MPLLHWASDTLYYFECDQKIEDKGTGTMAYRKTIKLHVISVVLILTMLAGCKDEARKTSGTPQAAQLMTAQPSPTLPTTAHAASGRHDGTVVEVVNTGRYTYVHVDTGDNKVWAAAPSFKVEVGDKVEVPPGAPMKDFHSKTLDRTFDLIYFVSSITRAGSKQSSSQLPKGHPSSTVRDTGAPGVSKMDFSGIVKAKEGKTVAEIYNEKANLSGKEIVVRGKVVKFSSGIMGKNWIHLKDGTDAEGVKDLTITTNAKVQVGDTILARGIVVTNKDYGYGYKYDVIIEEAKITVE